MVNTWIRRTVILLTLLIGTTSVRAQALPGYQPVFADEPKEVTGPEFCPPTPEPCVTKPPFEPVNPCFNAFAECCPPGCNPCVIYFGAGSIALMRESLGRGIIAQTDPGVDIPGVPANVDTGNQAPADAPVAVRFNDAGQNFRAGVQATAGVQWGRHAIEASGFYLSEHTVGETFTDPGRLDVLFGNYPFPLGFDGNQNLWLQADRVAVRLETRLANAEVNYRHIWIPQLELLAGVRYLDLREKFSIITDDDGVVAAPLDPFRVATHQVEARNHFVGGQVGFETQVFLAPRLAVGFTNKNMIGPNFIEVENRLIRGDGFEREPGRRSETLLSSLVELDAFATIWFGEQCRLRAGYQIFWLLQVPEAHQQVNFNPNETLGTVSNDDSLFFHGPRIELQFGF